MRQNIAVVAGSFDPITKGHIDLVERALLIFDKVYVVIGVNSDKKYMFNLNQRLEMLADAFTDNEDIIPTSYDGLIADFAKEKKAVIVKGVRFSSDFDYEHLQSESNYMINGVETIFLPSHTESTYITSSLVKELIKAERPFENYVTESVAKKIHQYLQLRKS